MADPILINPGLRGKNLESYGHETRTRLRADFPTPAEAGFAKAGALQRAGTVTLFWIKEENGYAEEIHC